MTTRKKRNIKWPLTVMIFIGSITLLALPIEAKTKAKGWSLLVMKNYKKPSDSELKKDLTAEQYAVTQKEATEPPFKNAYWNNKEAGIYVDIVSGEPLFSSLDKFDSGTGWPSFTKPIEEENIVKKNDWKLFYKRTEVKSKHANSHLGHLFKDGPLPEGKRYCINSAALKFIPLEKLKVEGYEAYLALFKKEKEPKYQNLKQRQAIATLAGGCFWGVEEILRKIPGVIEMAVGYTGGKLEHPKYENVKKGTTGHAEAVQVIFDPDKINYEKLLGYFFRLHDPTTLNRQGNDIGTQYRSAIFYHTEEQKIIASKIKEEIQKSGKWNGKITTEIVPAREFYKAEEYHQKYLQKNPGGYTCHYLRD